MNDLISQNIGTDPNAPRKAQWTSPNGLTTTGTMNPLGLNQNDPSIGYFGATPPVTPAPQPAPPIATPPVPPPPVAPNPAMTLLGPQGQVPPAPAPFQQPMITGDPRRPHPLLPEITTLPEPDANSPVQPAVEQPPPMSGTDLITGLRRPGMSNRGGMSRRVPGY